MKRFIAILTKGIEIDRKEYKKGDRLVVQESADYAPAYQIVEDGELTQNYITNEYGTVFKLAEELEIAA